MFIQRLNFKIVEIQFCKTLAKVTGSAVRINSKKPKVNKKKNDERKKKLEAATPGFELAPQLPPAKKVRLLTTRPCHHYTRLLEKLIV